MANRVRIAAVYAFLTVACDRANHTDLGTNAPQKTWNWGAGRILSPGPIDDATGLPSSLRDDGSGLVLILVKPGEYVRGAVDGDNEAEASEKPSHDARITKPFYLSECEITLDQWKLVIGSTWAEGLPAEFVAP
ncbi:MAG TPA: hypothetical protein VK843_12405, partial [Planctomycetota bacterium]|nr:hypothetical protein [Planctomycetota bacterium]